MHEVNLLPVLLDLPLGDAVDGDALLNPVGHGAVSEPDPLMVHVHPVGKVVRAQPVSPLVELEGGHGHELGRAGDGGPLAAAVPVAWEAVELDLGQGVRRVGAARPGARLVAHFEPASVPKFFNRSDLVESTKYHLSGFAFWRFG